MSTKFSPGTKYHILQALIKVLYEKQEDSSLQHIATITKANNILCTSDTAGFCHEGTDYHSLPENTRKLWSNLNPLQDSLVEQLNEYIHMSKTLHISLKRVEFYFSKVLGISKSVADIYALLPEVLHRYIPEEVSDYYGKDERTLPKEFITKFNEEHNEYIKLIKTRVITITLME